MTARLDPTGFAKALMLESAEIPPDMTLAQWRREKQAATLMMRRRRRVLRALRRRRAL